MKVMKGSKERKEVRGVEKGCECRMRERDYKMMEQEDARRKDMCSEERGKKGGPEESRKDGGGKGKKKRERSQD